jgi:hypothetical protein
MLSHWIVIGYSTQEDTSSTRKNRQYGIDRLFKADVPGAGSRITHWPAEIPCSQCSPSVRPHVSVIRVGRQQNALDEYHLPYTEIPRVNPHGGEKWFVQS